MLTRSRYRRPQAPYPPRTETCFFEGINDDRPTVLTVTNTSLDPLCFKHGLEARTTDDL